jgi:hypothetical protein
VTLSIKGHVNQIGVFDFIVKKPVIRKIPRIKLIAMVFFIYPPLSIMFCNNKTAVSFSTDPFFFHIEVSSSVDALFIL